MLNVYGVVLVWDGLEDPQLLILLSGFPLGLVVTLGFSVGVDVVLMAYSFMDVIGFLLDILYVVLNFGNDEILKEYSVVVFYVHDLLMLGYIYEVYF